MRLVATNFYSKLLYSEGWSLVAETSRREVWAAVHQTVTIEMRDTLNEPITVWGNCSSPSSTTKEKLPLGRWPHLRLINKQLDLCKEPLCATFQEVLDSGVMPAVWTEGLIVLIPKGEGPSQDIRKWSPITILNTVYKISAKVISLRLQPMLTNCIHSSQTGFLQERSILDNITTFWEATAAAIKNHKQLAVLLLDFEKAYDRVECISLHGTLLKFGFDERWIKGVSSYYSTASSKILWLGKTDQPSQFLILCDKDAPWPPIYFFSLQKR